METFIFVLVITQAVGAIIGAGGSVFAELFYLRAIQDGRIDEAERAHLKVIATALRYGMALLLASSIALAIIDFTYTLNPQPALTSEYWVLMTLVLVVIYASWALSRRRLSFMVGSAIAFTGWWFIALLTLGRMPVMSYGASIALYVVATVIISGVLQYARILTHKPV